MKARRPLAEMGAMKPAVSVLVLTYNHEAFLDQALDGLRRQRTRFPYEVVLADDCSSDATPRIAANWAARFDGNFRILPRPKNLGIAPNFISALAECTGRYVAILEGDDYWTDAEKLQKQYDFLESHSDHSACFHRVQLLVDERRLMDWVPLEGTKPSLEFLDVLVQNFVPNCSALMFRNEPPLRLPNWLASQPSYDWFLHVCNAERGRLAYLGEVMSVYRVRSQSAWHGKSRQEQATEVIGVLDRLDRHFDGRYEALLGAHAPDLAAAVARGAVAGHGVGTIFLCPTSDPWGVVAESSLGGPTGADVSPGCLMARNTGYRTQEFLIVRLPCADAGAAFTMFKLKRVYEEPSPQDGFRVLVERLWPRGLSKDRAGVDLWLKDLAPSTELRKWFGHDPAKWKEFQERYRAELTELQNETDSLRLLKEKAREGVVTLVYAAHDEAHNSALVLKQFLQRRKR